MRDFDLRGLAGKLLLGQVLVLAAAVVTVVISVVAFGPGVFRGDLSQHPDGFGQPQPLGHSYAHAILASLGIALVIATLTAIGLSVFLAVRLVRPLRHAADAADQMAAGGRGVRVEVPPSDDELSRLARSFNRMAGAVEEGERRRARLVSDVAHELRTPLTTIDGYLEGVEDGVVPADAATWALLRGQTARLRRLAEDLALVARTEERRVALELQPQPVRVLAAAAAAAAQPLFDQKGVALVVEADDAQALADAGPIGDVLANLLANALRHTDAGGRVELSGAAAGDAVELAVADDGDGIAAEELDRIFDRLYRTDQARDRDAGGSGLGLAICRAIVEAHDGAIRAESEGPGRGARFVITLPAA